MFTLTGYNKYDCTDSDAHLLLVTEDGKLNEIWVGDTLDNMHYMIGIEDLKNALALLGLEIVPKQRRKKAKKQLSYGEAVAKFVL